MIVNIVLMGLENAEAEPGSNAQKIGDLFAMGMDSVRLNAEGIKLLCQDWPRRFPWTRFSGCKPMRGLLQQAAR